MRFLGEVMLRNLRRAYYDERSRYYIVEEDRGGRVFQSRVLPENADIMRKVLGSQVVNVDDVDPPFFAFHRPVAGAWVLRESRQR